MMCVGLYIDSTRAVMMVLIMSLASLSGCFGEEINQPGMYYLAE